jgi:hypothetical protein
MVDIEMHLQKGFYTVARGEMKGKRNEASQPRKLARILLTLNLPKY